MTGMKVGIIGAGLQATRRGLIIMQFPDSKIVSITATKPESAMLLAKSLNCKVAKDWREVIKENLDAVMVLTPPHLHAEISIEAMKRGMHVLCEKPFAKTEQECLEMIKTAKENNVILKCGFNHRHHPAVQQVKKWFDNGEIGKINFIRSKHGAGGRPGIENEWRSDPKIVSGGQLMEQGVHTIDLMRWFIGEPSEVTCFTTTQYWKISPLEDNAFVIFKTKEGQLVNIHSSLTQWKNVFSFEIFGTEGYAIVEGLGGGYGTERAILGKKEFQAPFKETIIEYRGEDKSWYEEWKEFLNAIKEKREPVGNGYDGYQSIRLVLAAYRSSREGKSVKIT